ncbi:DUF3379 family protein [Pseudoalteromonas denitrificans]|uniref:Transmembrane transcriptional regulator (Anti-sigma factor RsiW) n=1 Tax=Pseudoalteromonas denitrificans DSM 6059 TaxID=1123010 RepID=A0A1I1HEJ7_9GAMM|nr:DUF3379 family protein [Pseudoalteromonas denitrificans]SFC22394.1 Protein of unknown function [Pseudoalteromonas denitrificans DSM 6059]
MDELEFRRRLYAEPHVQDPLLDEFAQTDPERKKFMNDIKQLDKDIEQALNIPVPENLASKLILNQAIDSHRVEKKKRRVHLAIAASVAFSFSVLVNFSLKQGPLDIGQHALAHVNHEIRSLDPTDRRYQIDQVNTQLASFGGHVSKLPGEITYSTFCDFDGQRSLHLVFQTEQGPVTLFIVPSINGYKAESEFKNERFNGQIYQTKKANIIMVGDKGQSLNKYQKQLADNIIWEA